jgi:hypothetical protein
MITCDECTREVNSELVTLHRKCLFDLKMKIILLEARIAELEGIPEELEGTLFEEEDK